VVFRETACWIVLAIHLENYFVIVGCLHHRQDVDVEECRELLGQGQRVERSVVYLDHLVH
ncbi:hypothetical protein, partial [Bifidobacterium breve]|uniref:hypothetical protein n=1 Tax=Bifidobacterium breve TaxID=1685 RepID=UPI003D00D85E